MLEVRAVETAFLRRAGPPTIRVVPADKGSPGYVSFDTDAFEIAAAVTLAGDGRGARLGWTQIIHGEVDRAVFRGTSPDAGRVAVFRDRAKQGGGALCRDVMRAGDVFTCPPGRFVGLGYQPLGAMNIDLTGERLPGTVVVSHADKPAGGWMDTWDNERTRRPNYLSWALTRIRFCAVLLLRQPDGRLEQLGHFYWAVVWESRFAPVMPGHELAGLRPVASGAGCHIGFKPFVHGPVTDGRFAALIAAPNGPTCNDRGPLRNETAQVQQFTTW